MAVVVASKKDYPIRLQMDDYEYIAMVGIKTYTEPLVKYKVQVVVPWLKLDLPCLFVAPP